MPCLKHSMSHTTLPNQQCCANPVHWETSASSADQGKRNSLIELFWAGEGHNVVPAQWTQTLVTFIDECEEEEGTYLNSVGKCRRLPRLAACWAGVWLKIGAVLRHSGPCTLLYFSLFHLAFLSLLALTRGNVDYPLAGEHFCSV